MADDTTERAGSYKKQPGGYTAFIPRPLPPDPPVEITPDLLGLLSDADRLLGRLDGMATTLPDPDLFVAMYVLKEAVLSSQIEGTQASLVDVLEFEAQKPRKRILTDAVESVNYVKAMNYGLARLKELPLSLRLIREIHARLLAGTRGSERDPGEFRKIQNWIGPEGCPLEEASYVPPPIDGMKNALGDLEEYLHDDRPTPPLIKCALVHSQFETIHPFLDGNGRIGRLLITLILCERGVMAQPLLYLSYYFKRNRAEYYDRLQAVRDSGNWESWVAFFLRGVAEVSAEATETTAKILRMREEHTALLQEKMRTSNGPRLLDRLFSQPIVSVADCAAALETTAQGARRIVGQFESLGILREMTGRQRGRLYAYREYLDMLSRGTEPPAVAGEPVATEN